MKPPILLIHGACSQPAHLEPWRAWFADAGYGVVAPALPAHAPGEFAALRSLTVGDYLAAIREVHAGLGEPPVVIGHSMGGLIAQMLAAEAPCAAVVLVSSMPGYLPGTLTALPHFVTLVPQVLLGQPFRPRPRSLATLTLHDLSAAEREELLPDFVAESGRAYRQILLGLARVRSRDLGCPVLVVQGAADRLVPAFVGRGLARKYHGDLMIVPGHGHWLIAGSLLDEVAVPVLGWLRGRGSASRRPSFPPAMDV